MNSKISNELFPFERVPDVKAQPGLYAWYLRIRVGRSNIGSSQNFSNRLKKITEQIRHPSLAMQLHGNFNMNMKGKLKHIWYGHNDYPFTENFQEMLNHPEERELISNILDLAVPLLSGPLYIGVSKNLQKRLQTHTRLIEKYSKEQQEDNMLEAAVDSPDLLQNDKEFADRIVDRNIDPNHLIVGITYVSHPDFSPDRIRKIVETTEVLLNRIFYPILGKK